MTLISKMIIFKLKYKILGFRAGPSPNGVRPKIPERPTFLWTYKTKPKPGNI